jgi:hypothetical protein
MGIFLAMLLRLLLLPPPPQWLYPTDGTEEEALNADSCNSLCKILEKADGLLKCQHSETALRSKYIFDLLSLYIESNYCYC